MDELTPESVATILRMRDRIAELERWLIEERAIRLVGIIWWEDEDEPRDEEHDLVTFRPEACGLFPGQARRYLSLHRRGRSSSACGNRGCTHPRSPSFRS